MLCDAILLRSTLFLICADILSPAFALYPFAFFPQSRNLILGSFDLKCGTNHWLLRLFGYATSTSELPRQSVAVFSWSDVCCFIAECKKCVQLLLDVLLLMAQSWMTVGSFYVVLNSPKFVIYVSVDCSDRRAIFISSVVDHRRKNWYWSNDPLHLGKSKNYIKQYMAMTSSSVTHDPGRICFGLCYIRYVSYSVEISWIRRAIAMLSRKSLSNWFHVCPNTIERNQVENKVPHVFSCRCRNNLRSYLAHSIRWCCQSLFFVKKTVTFDIDRNDVDQIVENRTNVMSLTSWEFTSWWNFWSTSTINDEHNLSSSIYRLWNH